MKKTISFILIAALACALALVLASCNKTSGDKLIVYNWEDYISEDVIADFEAYYKEKTGKDIKVQYSTFDTNETMLTKIINNDAQVDVICPSEYAIERLLKKGLLAKLDLDAMPNYGNTDVMIRDAIDSVFGNVDTPSGKVNMNDYFAPYMWGTLGIIYNTDKVTPTDLEQGWGLLWNKAGNPILNGKILMKDSIRDAIAATVFYLKENDRLPESAKGRTVQELINEVNKELLDAIEVALKEQKPHLKGYEVDFGKDDMVGGIAYVDLAWSGDAMWAIGEADNLDYFVPTSGSNIWFDGWVIPASSTQKEAAQEWINFLCLPDIAMKNMMEIEYTAALSPEVLQESSEAIEVLLDNGYNIEAFFSDIRRYPTDVAHLGIMQDLGEGNDQAIDMWERVKASSNNIWVIVFSILGGIIIIGGIVVFFITRKKRRRIAPVRPDLAKMDFSGSELQKKSDMLENEDIAEADAISDKFRDKDKKD